MLLPLLASVLVCVLARFLWRRWRYDLHRVPSPPRVPLLGHTLEFLAGEPTYQLSQWTGRCLKQLGYPKLMRVDVFGRIWLFVTDQSFIKDVMMSRTAPFPKFMADGGLVLPVVGNDASVKSMAMTAVPTPYVKAVRRIYASAFQASNLKEAMTEVNKVIDNVIDVIDVRREDGPVECQDLFVRMMLDAIGAVAFEANLGGLDGSRDIHDLCIKVGYICLERMRNWLQNVGCRYFPNSLEARKRNSIIKALTAEWDKLTNEILERGDPSDGRKPIWFALRNLKDPETGRLIPYTTLRSEVATVVLGGSDTTGHQLGWLFAALAAHPHVIQKLLAELRAYGLYGSDAREVAFEDLGELTYLTAIIKEGMRIAHIVTASFLRVVPQDMTILGYRIPKNTLIICPGTRGVDSEEMWGDPHVFRPERWLTDDDMSQKYAFGFSFGPRDCIGQKLAMMEMRLTIIRLVVRYEFSLKGDWEELLRSSQDGLVVEARDGIWLKMKPRTAE